jgi:predicted acylesterase/phospholipase RssA
MTLRHQAEEIVGGGSATVATVASLANELRDSGAVDAVAPLLIAVSRRALYDGWEADQRAALAQTLRDHQQFGYARRLLGRVRRDSPDSERLRQQEALCTYKDMELPAARRLDRALEILGEGETPLADSMNAETLGIAGAIYKRKWDVDAKRMDIENAYWCYERGFAQEDEPEREYAGVNAAFVADKLAELEDRGLGISGEAARLRERADEIRRDVVGRLRGGDGGWHDATLGEALFGLGRLDEARVTFARVGAKVKDRWRQETTAMQLAALAQLRGLDASGALTALVGDAEGAVVRAVSGKVGLALSGGGYRASLFHIGVLARLAECNVLRRIEVLSCVSGGSILGAHYYLKLRRLLQSKPDGQIEDVDYVTLVDELAKEFLAGVQKNLRGRLTTNLADDARMLASRYSRTDRAAELFQELLFSKVPRDEPDEVGKPWRMTDLFITPKDSERDFSLRYDNWRRSAKVPMLVLNATTLNTGHNWQFTASWMGEPPVGAELRVDASRRLRRMYYHDAPPPYCDEPPLLARAVAASACVPGLFPPIALTQLYDGLDVELVDGGVHDNQGVASVLEQDCRVVLVSDASGQMGDEQHPSRHLLKVSKRANSILMSRVRGAQYSDLASRERSGTLRGLMIVHLKKGLPAAPRDWSGCVERWSPDDDALPVSGAAQRPPYRIDPHVQRALAELRTDLDAFSDVEAYSLMAAGYEMARCELAGALPELATADPKLEQAVQWPFEQALAALADPGAKSRLVRALGPGSARFFRRLKAWRLRHARPDDEA